MNDCRIICAFDEKDWENHVGPDVVYQLGGSMRMVFDHALNIFPWLGYGDMCVAREMVENAVYNYYGKTDGKFDENVDRCFHAIWDLTSYLQQTLGQPRVPDSYVTGGRVEAMGHGDVIFVLHFDGI
jgi:hypothetical protein